MITTKEQERKALEKIRKIIAELGEDSYVATAFEGCLEDAEENIENDFALSYYDRYYTAVRTIDALNEKIKSYEEKEKRHQVALEIKEKEKGAIEEEKRIVAGKLTETEQRLDLAEERLNKFYGAKGRIMKTLNEKRKQVSENADADANDMAYFAEKGYSEGLEKAVKGFRESKAELGELEELIRELGDM